MEIRRVLLSLPNHHYHHARSSSRLRHSFFHCSPSLSRLGLVIVDRGYYRRPQASLRPLPAL